MKKNDWVYLANAMWTYSEKNEGRISSLLKQLIKEINNSKEMIENDMGEYEQNATSDRPIDANSTDKSDFTGLGNLHDGEE
tara:strand:- start:17300 stop:17542 length:243 start_codon:yes stop_codon:yes gene_type:complete